MVFETEAEIRDGWGRAEVQCRQQGRLSVPEAEPVQGETECAGVSEVLIVLWAGDVSVSHLRNNKSDFSAEEGSCSAQVASLDNESDFTL